MFRMAVHTASMNLAILWVWLAAFILVAAAADSLPTNCSSYSSLADEEFWDAVSRCPACAQASQCGYCMSTLQCMEGTSLGPSNGTPCPSWTFDGSICPNVPNCKDYSDCGSCAKMEECAWCASEEICTTVSDAFSRECRGLVFEPPCPDSFVSENVIVGNLVVKADPSFGGGSLNISGKSYVAVCMLCSMMCNANGVCKCRFWRR